MELFLYKTQVFSSSQRDNLCLWRSPCPSRSLSNTRTRWHGSSLARSGTSCPFDRRSIILSPPSLPSLCPHKKKTRINNQNLGQEVKEDWNLFGYTVKVQEKTKLASCENFDSRIDNLNQEASLVCLCVNTLLQMVKDELNFFGKFCLNAKLTLQIPGLALVEIGLSHSHSRETAV